MMLHILVLITCAKPDMSQQGVEGEARLGRAAADFKETMKTFREEKLLKFPVNFFLQNHYMCCVE